MIMVEAFEYNTGSFLSGDIPELLLGVEGLTKTNFHTGGCACSACHEDGDGHDHGTGGKSFQPGGLGTNMTDSVPGDATTTATLTPGSRITGNIETNGDSDWFRIDLTAGETYTFATFLANGGLRDSVLTLRDSAGNVVTTNDDASSSLRWSEIIHTATTTGTFFLEVTGFGTGTGEYNLHSSRPTNDAVAGDATSTASLTLGAAATSGSIDQTGDRDWYAVTLEAGQIYEFITSAVAATGDADTTLTLRDSSGNIVAFNDDSSGTYSRIRAEVASSGTYYLEVGGWADSSAGAYQVTAAEAAPLEEFSNDQIAGQLLNGYWGGPGTERRWNVSEGDTITVNVTGLTAEGQFLAREALGLWSDILGVTFSEVTTNGQITFDDDEDGAFASSARSGGFITSSEVNVSTAWLTNSGTTLDSYSFQTYIHEIGHALGLGHGGNYNGNADYTQDANYLNDSWATTVMSYFSQSENGFFSDQNFSRVFVISPQIADIVAIQQSYGLSTTTRTGDNTYGVGNNTGRDIYGTGTNVTNNAGNLLSFTIFDNGGIDTLDYSTFSANQTINLNQEEFSNVGGSIGNMNIARGTVIENAVGGTGNDNLIGNAENNRLDGGAGTDNLYGGAGNDTFVVNVQADIVYENAGEGTDTVESSGNFYLYANIENLTLTGSAGNFGVGNELDNTLRGNAGENLLIAGLGADTVYGGDARDSIFGEDGADMLYGEAGVDYIVGGAGNDMIYGGADADELFGGAGDDTIYAGDSFDTDIVTAGAGDDIIYINSGLNDYDLADGGAGDDTYYVDTGDDLTFEAAGGGNDTVIANINVPNAGVYLYAHVENLILEGNTAFGVGNELNNQLTGSNVGNTLLGGLGNDTINGGGGNDILFGEGGSDTFVFSAGTGVDTIGDFASGQDKLDLSAYGLTFAQWQDSFVQVGNDGAIDLGNGDLIILQGVNMASLTASDIITAPVAEPEQTDKLAQGDDLTVLNDNAVSGGSAGLGFAGDDMLEWGDNGIFNSIDYPALQNELYEPLHEHLFA